MNTTDFISTTKNDNDIEILQTTVVIVSVLLFFGVPPNLLSIGLISRARNKKSTTTYLLLSLAIADIFNLFGSLPVAISLYINRTLLETENPIMALIMTPKCVANITLAFLALERYNALVKVMTPLGILSSKRNIVLILTITWLLSLSIYVPVSTFMWLGHLQEFEIKIYFIVCLMISFFLPLFVALFCYGMIFKGIFYDGTILGKKVTNKAEFQDRKRTVRILIVITMFFIACNFPTIVLKLLKVTSVTIHNDFMLTAMFMLSSLSSAVNPYIYGLQSERYRRQVKELFCYKRQNRHVIQV